MTCSIQIVPLADAPALGDVPVFIFQAHYRAHEASCFRLGSFAAFQRPLAENVGMTTFRAVEVAQLSETTVARNRASVGT